MSAEAVRRALLVGINQYPDPNNNLKGCVNDVLLMGKVITENFGFNPENIRLLTDKRATTANIRERLRWLVEGARPGSVLLFHYSGHGSQVRDRNGDELDDQLDEIICPYDLDWDDPFTDDEFAKVIESVPEGVNLTLILDCCNSGTGTRQFFKEPSARGATANRFLVPPPDVAYRMAAGIEVDNSTPERTVNMVGLRELPKRQFGASLVGQNAILMSASRSDQTSADAWIESDYNGAFTYSLVQAMRSERYSLSYSNLVEAAGAWLKANSYTQIPQLETRQAMQGWGFLDTQKYERGTAAVVGRSIRETFTVASDTRFILVHGAQDNLLGYSDGWRGAFNRYLGLPRENFVEVAWDELFDKRAMNEHGLTSAPELDTDEQQRAADLTEELRVLIESRFELVSDITTDSATSLLGAARDRFTERRLFDWLVNFDDYIQDFANYLASVKVRAAVDTYVSGKLMPLLRSGVPTVLVTHSWASVIGYNVLRSLPSSSCPSLHCSLGSPLWMHPVRKILGLDNRTRGSEYWINVNTKGDLVGGSLAGKFAVNEDHSVSAVAGSSPQSSYFHPENVVVQRDIVAAAISKILSGV